MSKINKTENRCFVLGRRNTSYFRAYGDDNTTEFITPWGYTSLKNENGRWFSKDIKNAPCPIHTFRTLGEALIHVVNNVSKLTDTTVTNVGGNSNYDIYEVVIKRHNEIKWIRKISSGKDFF